jgi:hypothetical protein
MDYWDFSEKLDPPQYSKPHCKRQTEAGLDQQGARRHAGIEPVA